MYALNGSQSYSTLLKISWRRAWAAIVNGLWFALILTGLKNGGFYIADVWVSGWVQTCLVFFLMFLEYLTLCCMLLCSHAALRYEKANPLQVALRVLSNSFRLFSIVFFIPVCVVLILLLFYRISILFSVSTSVNHKILFFVGSLVSTFLVFQLLLILFSIPLVLIYNMRVWDSLKSSMKMTIQFVYRLLVVYAGAIFIYYTASTDTFHGQWLQQHYLAIPFDFVVYALTLPLLFNVMLVIFQDLYTRFLRLEEDIER